MLRTKSTMRHLRYLILLGLVNLASTHINMANDINKVIGYVGPACVVVDDLFYLHGHFIRRLAPEEILAFKKYQNTLSLLRQLREAVSKGATLLNNGTISLPTPVIPDFCNGFDDSPEVVLDGCTIRTNHVYIGDRVIRPINLIEKQRINAIIASFFSPVRSRRFAEQPSPTSSVAKPKNASTTAKATKAKPNPSTTTEFPLSKELKELISNTLNISANVTERFLPIAQASPLFNNLLRQRELLLEPRSDDPRGYASVNQPLNAALFDGLKAQKTTRSGMSANLNTATEIPHLFVDEQSPPAGGQVAGGQLNPFDPLLLHLLQSLASRQENVNEIIRQQKLVQQQLHQNQMPVSQTQHQPFILPPPSAHSIKVGETMLIGGQPYLAVQLNSEPNGLPAVGLVAVPSTSNTHTVTALPPIINWMSNAAQPAHYPPSGGMSFNNFGFPAEASNFAQFAPQEAVRYHPGKRIEINSATMPPLYVNGIPLPHEICRAHLLDPFVWART